MLHACATTCVFPSLSASISSFSTHNQGGAYLLKLCNHLWRMPCWGSLQSFWRIFSENKFLCGQEHGYMFSDIGLKVS